jgi:60 kDa SS-A/Ro ribonucleoprotein
MSRFNTKSQSTKIVNRAGGEAFAESPKLAFVSILLTSFLKDQFYRSKEDSMADLIEAMNKISDKEFVAKAAVYARNEFGMRSVTHIVGAELAHAVKGEKWMRPFLYSLIRRPDDMVETWSYYMSKYGKPIPNSMRIAFKKAFGKFDNYQIQKYRMQDKKYKLVDLLNYARPVPTEKNKEAIEALIKGVLKASNTWNADLSNAGREDGDVDTSKAEVWKKLLAEKKLPYFALLRNLRNIVEQAPDLVDQASELLENEAMIKKSLIFPFRFVTASKQLKEDGINEPRIYKALNKALEISFSNVPKLDGKTLVVVDHSGSMDSIEHGNLTNFEIGALFGITLAKSNNADFMYFGDEAKYAAFDPSDSTQTLISYLSNLNEGRTAVGHGTNFHAIFQEANKAYDRICIFSDMQGWIGYNTPTSDFEAYKKRCGANPKIYSFDLAGYGDLQFPEDQIYCLAGFSDKIFGLMKLMETDKKSMLSAIEQIQL